MEPFGGGKKAPEGFPGAAGDSPLGVASHSAELRASPLALKATDGVLKAGDVTGEGEDAALKHGEMMF